MKKRDISQRKKRKGQAGIILVIEKKENERERIWGREKRRKHSEKERTRHQVCLFFLFACTFIHGIK